MPSMLSARTVVTAVCLSAVVIGASSVGASGASTSAGPTVAKPPKTVTATRIARRRGTLAPGAAVRRSAVTGQRVFTDAKHGFALAPLDGADYAVATADGGKTWKTHGPALHLHAAQAPLAVVFIGAVDRRTVFAWGGGQVIDTTSDGGKTWYSALFTVGSPIAVAGDLQGHLLGFVGSFSGGAVWLYVSSDGGRTWRYRTAVGR